MKMQRSAGILLPISSLPSPYGIGCFSQEAYDFVDWLKEAGQTYWQILPLGVTSYGDSPIRAFCLRQPVFHQSGRTGGGRGADRRRVQKGKLWPQGR